MKTAFAEDTQKHNQQLVLFKKKNSTSTSRVTRLETLNDMAIYLSAFAMLQFHVDFPSDNLRVDTVVAPGNFKGGKKSDKIGLYLLTPYPLAN